MRDFCIFEDTPRLFLLGNRQFTFIAHNLDVAEDVVGQICHRHIRLRPYNPYCPDNKAVHTLLFKTEYVLDKARVLDLRLSQPSVFLSEDDSDGLSRRLSDSCHAPSRLTPARHILRQDTNPYPCLTHQAAAQKPLESCTLAGVVTYERITLLPLSTLTCCL